MLCNFLYFLIFSSSLFCAQENKIATSGGALSSAAKPLDCVTHIPEIQKMIAGYCDLEWVPVTELCAQDVSTAKSTEKIDACACSPDGRFIAYISDELLINGTLHIWDQEKQVLTQVAVDLPIKKESRYAPNLELLASPRSDCFMVSCRDILVFILYREGHWISMITTHAQDDEPRAMALSSDGKWLAQLHAGKLVLSECSKDYFLRYTQSFYVGAIPIVPKLLFTHDHSKILVFEVGSDYLLVIDLKTGRNYRSELPSVPLQAATVTLFSVENCLAMQCGHVTGIYKMTGTDPMRIAAEPEKYVTIEGGLIDAIVLFDKSYAAFSNDGDICVIDFQEDLNRQLNQDYGVTFSNYIAAIARSTPARISFLHGSVDGKYLTAQHTNGLIKRWINLSHYLLEKNRS